MARVDAPRLLNGRLKDFRFQTFTDLTDGELKLELDEHLQGDRAMDRVPAYKYRIVRCWDNQWVGDIDIRIGNTRQLVLYGGHIGYSVHDFYRGHRYAAKACLIIRRIAEYYDMPVLWITCNPDNRASRRTCELVGAELVNIVDVPAGTELFRRGDYKKCRYRWQILGDQPTELPSDL